MSIIYLNPRRQGRRGRPRRKNTQPPGNMMRTQLLLTAALALAAPARAETDLNCEPLKPAARVVRVSRMQPIRREKAWLEGSPKSVVSVTCDLRGMKTEEAEAQSCVTPQKPNTA